MVSGQVDIRTTRGREFLTVGAATLKLSDVIGS